MSHEGGQGFHGFTPSLIDLDCGCVEPTRLHNFRTELSCRQKIMLSRSLLSAPAASILAKTDVRAVSSCPVKDQRASKAASDGLLTSPGSRLLKRPSRTFLSFIARFMIFWRSARSFRESFRESFATRHRGRVSLKSVVRERTVTQAAQKRPWIHLPWNRHSLMGFS